MEYGRAAAAVTSLQSIVSLVKEWTSLLRFPIVNSVYLLALMLASPWLIYSAIMHGKYRAGIAAKFLGHVSCPPKRDRRRLWVHAVSVGEVALADVILKPIRARWPQVEIVVSTTSKTGFELAQQRFPDLTVTYAPLDFSWSVRAALDRVQPDTLMLIELELWPNLIWAAKRRDVSVFVVNGRLSESSHRGYRRIRPLVASVLRCIDLVTAAQEEYAQRFIDLGLPTERVTAVGSIKFDGAETDRRNSKTLELGRLAGFDQTESAAALNCVANKDEVFFVAGSTQAPEELMALSAYRQLASRHPNLRLIIVPRHPERFDEVTGQLDEAGADYVCRTQIDRPLAAGQVLVVDTVGELGAWWGWADIAFVGGSMGNRGGQNMIEPSAFGAAVCFGPNTRNFREVTNQLIAADAARTVRSTKELTGFVRDCLDDPAWSSRIGANAKALVLRNRGALQRTIDQLAPTLDRVCGLPQQPETSGGKLRGPHATRNSSGRAQIHDRIRFSD